jgi:hypothetical protein
MDQARRAAIIQALAHCDHNVGKAAIRLRIGRSTMYRLMDEFAIEGVERYGARLSQEDDQQPARPALTRHGETGSERPRQGRLVHVDGDLFLVR